MIARPSISVVVPFAGTAEEGTRIAAGLGALRLAVDDELVVADNTPDGRFGANGDERIKVVRATAEQSSYHARNVGARAATGDWLLFLDADCIPPPTLLDDYFSNPVSGDCGLLAGGIVAASPRSISERYAASRRMLDSVEHVGVHPLPTAVTANLCVRRTAWERVGGFYEGIRSHGDGEFCWRVQEAGWRLSYVPEANVEHRHRKTLRGLSRQVRSYGRGAAWLNRHRPGSCPRPRLGRALGRSLVGASRWAFVAQRERATFKLIDGLVAFSYALGYLGTNTVPRRAPAVSGRPRVALLADSFPVLSETFVVNEARTLAELGAGIQVEAIRRSHGPVLDEPGRVPVGYLEDASILQRLAAAARIAVRHPLTSVREVISARGWPCDERVSFISLSWTADRLSARRTDHLHAHFAATSAVSAARIAPVMGISYSVTAHAYEIFISPQGLNRKLAGAAFVTTGCRYNVEHLQRLVAAPLRSRIHEIVMGVDTGAFRRDVPYPGGRVAIAVGRLIEKKGFDHLLKAGGMLIPRGDLERLLIAGDGPLAGELRRLASDLGIEDRVEFQGALSPGEVRKALLGADLLIAPSVVASNGDRDSMPVVVKEAMAMELPVVASDEVGLPEVVKPDWGRLARPGDAVDLAERIAEVVALPIEERRRMGRAAREWVQLHGNLRRETAKLLDLINDAVGPLADETPREPTSPSEEQAAVAHAARQQRGQRNYVPNRVDRPNGG